MRIEEPSRAAAPRGFALFNLAFRPFYLLAALFAALSIALWVATLHGLRWNGYLPPVLWHQHEMLFGFALAVITGFLLTAGRVWTGRPTPEGWPLAVLALHWIAARVLVFTGPAPVAALVDGAFAFVVAALMARAIVGARNARNYFVIVLLCAFGAANVAFHLQPGDLPVRAGLWLVMTLIVVMAGRVVPSFTANALPRAGVVMRPKLDRIALALTLAVFAADLLALGAAVVAPLALAAATLHAARQWGWLPLATRGRPILWILHLSHAWIPLGFVFLALESLRWVATAVTLHAFGAGAMGGLIIAMITRTALGHTGRPLAAGGAEVAAYVLLHLAAALRVFAGLAPGASYLTLIALSGVLWSAAFLVYFATYLPRLARPRLDGKPG
ncbi:MAG: NnrS family protein [Betaproteobacteria bacterium]|nr:MAG: NnrS family protein [Betaproteobacteria bacterium]